MIAAPEEYLISIQLHMPRRDVDLRAVHGFSVVEPIAPTVVNPLRREACRYDLKLFKRTYYPHYKDVGDFHGPFLSMLQDLTFSKGNKFAAWAAPRGIAKTTDKVIADVWALLYGHRNFAMWIAANRPLGEKRLGMIKASIFENELLNEDFPEICGPVREFGGDARVAHPYVWTAGEILMPNDAHAYGIGIDGGIIGTIDKFARPDSITIDDPEDEVTVVSEAETKMRRAKIEKEISGMAELGGCCMFVMLLTIRKVGCLADEYTNPRLQPSWNGRRFKARLTEPLRKDLWDTYMLLAREIADEPSTAAREWLDKVSEKDAAAAWSGLAENAEVSADTLKAFQDLDYGYRIALRFFARNRAEMMNGIKMLDESRLPAHQFYYMQAVKGEDFVASEYQQEPKENPNITSKLLDASQIQKRQSRLSAGTVPHWATHGLATIDIGVNQLYWEFDAWNRDGSVQVVQWGIESTHAKDDGAFALSKGAPLQSGLVIAGILSALKRLRERFDKGFPRQGGGLMYPVLIGIDCGGTVGEVAWMEHILVFTYKAGPKWIPMKGVHPWPTKTRDRALGRNWIREETEKNPAGRVDWYTTEYKLRLWDAYQVPLPDNWETPPAGARVLHMDEPREQRGIAEYARQQTSERHESQFIPGKQDEHAEKAAWYRAVPQVPNHLWDTAAMNYALNDVARDLRRKMQQGRPPRPPQGIPNNRGSDPAMG